MKKSESYLTALEIKMNAIIYKYEETFKKSPNKHEEFLNINGEKIDGELTQVTIDTIHNSIISDMSNDENFMLSIQKLKDASIVKFKLNLKRIELEKSVK